MTSTRSRSSASSIGGLARQCKVDEAELVARLKALGEQVPDRVREACAAALSEGLSTQIVEPLAAQLIAHVRARYAGLG